MHFIYGMALNPNCVCIITELISHVQGGVHVPFITTIGFIVYGLIALWLLFYPLAGYLADVCYGRYKVVIFSLRMIWFALAFLVVIGVLLNTIIILAYLLCCTF